MRFARFALVGGLCAGLNNVFVIAFAQAGLAYHTASILAFGPLVVIGYGLHTAFSFEAPPSWRAFARYTLAMAANFPIWIAALYLFCGLLGMRVAIAAPLTTVLVFLWNYVAAKRALVPVRD